MLGILENHGEIKTPESSYCLAKGNCLFTSRAFIFLTENQDSEVELLLPKTRIETIAEVRLLDFFFSDRKILSFASLSTMEKSRLRSRIIVSKVMDRDYYRDPTSWKPKEWQLLSCSVNTQFVLVNLLKSYHFLHLCSFPKSVNSVGRRAFADKDKDRDYYRYPTTRIFFFDLKILYQTSTKSRLLSRVIVSKVKDRDYHRGTTSWKPKLWQL